MKTVYTLFALLLLMWAHIYKAIKPCIFLSREVNSLNTQAASSLLPKNCRIFISSWNVGVLKLLGTDVLTGFHWSAMLSHCTYVSITLYIRIHTGFPCCIRLLFSAAVAQFQGTNHKSFISSHWRCKQMDRVLPWGTSLEHYQRFPFSQRTFCRCRGGTSQ